MTLAEFESELIRERKMAGLQAARARGRRGGREFALTKAQVRLAQAAMVKRNTSVSELCKELGFALLQSTDTSIQKEHCAIMGNGSLGPEAVNIFVGGRV